MRRLKQLNSADLNYVRLVSHIRQRQSNIRQKFDCGFRRRISHAANKMHKLCLLARLPSNRFFSGWSTQMPCAETQALFIMASTSTACNVCFKTTKYTCLDCGLHFCIPRSVFEEDEEVPGWMAGRCVARCDACFRELLEKIGDRGDQVVKERQTPEIGTPDENSQNGKKRNR